MFPAHWSASCPQAERDVRASSVMMLYEELTVTSDRNIALHQHAAENVKQRQAVVFREMQDAAAEADARKQRLTAMMAEALSEQVRMWKRSARFVCRVAMHCSCLVQRV